MIVKLLEKRVNKNQFKALVLLLGGDFKVIKFKDGYAYQVIINNKEDEEFCFSTRKEAYLAGKRAFKKMVNYANN